MNRVTKYDHLVGKDLAEGRWSWNADRALLYAVGVGAGLDDPLAERQFTTENTPGLPQQVIPSFLTLMKPEVDWTRSVDFFSGGKYPTGLVHGEQAITLMRPIPTHGEVRVTQRLIGVYDKGSGALMVVETRVTLAATDEVLGLARMGGFAIGRGGFGGPRGPEDGDEWHRPERQPDRIVSLPTALNQTLVYRLLGDRNPHGTDPAKARADGFEKPVFLGLGTYGVACRALLRGVCEGDVARFGGMSGRFSQAVYPGDRLDTLIWLDEGGARFQVLANGERVVFDRGRFHFRGGPGPV